MNREETPEVIRKQQITEYIMYLMRTCGTPAPAYQENWIVLVPADSYLATFDTILSHPIYCVDSLGGSDFMIAVPAEQTASRKWLQVFEERRDRVEFRKDGNYGDKSTNTGEHK